MDQMLKRQDDLESMIKEQQNKISEVLTKLGQCPEDENDNKKGKRDRKIFYQVNIYLLLFIKYSIYVCIFINNCIAGCD
jgi:hypothetical protein